MNAKDQYKLTQRGIIILRADQDNLKIKAKTKDRPEWHYIDPNSAYKNKTEMRREMINLLKSTYIIED